MPIKSKAPKHAVKSPAKGHSAKSLFDLNIESAKECIKQHRGLQVLQSKLNTDWLLRAAVVFAVSALDAYFHDKVKYRIGKFRLDNMPQALARFEIELKELQKWSKSRRKGNLIRNWVSDYLATRPLQRQEAIADALRMAGIDGFWSTIEANPALRKKLVDTFDQLIKRRNQIAHEGDRKTSRRSGKTLRAISEQQVQDWIDWAISFVATIERKIPN
jgi:hypothetical protein